MEPLCTTEVAGGRGVPGKVLALPLISRAVHLDVTPMPTLPAMAISAWPSGWTERFGSFRPVDERGRWILLSLTQTR
jgi:hypothetical protein